MMNLNEALRMLRHRAGLTQKQLADMLELGPVQLYLL